MELIGFRFREDPRYVPGFSASIISCLLSVIATVLLLEALWRSSVSPWTYVLVASIPVLAFLLLFKVRQVYQFAYTQAKEGDERIRKMLIELVNVYRWANVVALIAAALILMYGHR